MFQVLMKCFECAAEWFAWAREDDWHALRVVAADELAARMQWCHANEDSWTLPLSNVWLGVSVEDQATAAERIPVLLGLPVTTRFASYEPALGPVTFTDVVSDGIGRDALRVRDGGTFRGAPERHLDWVIVGGESGAGARPFELAWARSTVEACRAAGVACFVKQLGANVFDPSRLSWHAPDDDGEIGLWEVGHRVTRQVASIWAKGIDRFSEARFTWHTWDRQGTGGENDSETTLEKAKAAVERALVRQHTHAPKGWWRHRPTLTHRKGADVNEWPEDLRVREFPS